MPTRPLADARSLALTLALFAGCSVPIGGAALAQAPAGKATPPKGDAAPKDPREQQAKDVAMLADFLHYIMIDRADLAKAMGQGLLDRKFTPMEFAELVDKTPDPRRFGTAIGRAERLPGLEGVAAQVRNLYDAGKLTQVREPSAIDKNIKLLAGDEQQRAYGRERLMAAGDYAVPQLFTTFIGGADPVLNARIRQILVDMGRHAVMPLVTALPRLTPTQQEQVALILGDSLQTQALPFLYDLASTSKVGSVKTAAHTAIHNISGSVNEQMSVSERYNDLADAYFKGSPSLISFPGDSNQLVWDYQPGTGLTFQAVDSKVYPQTMAMKVSEMALRKDAASSRAVSTWIAADFSRELRSPEGYENPVYGQDRREAMYYAVAAGPSVDQSVLAKALDAGDTPLVRKALAALEKTGGRDLWASYKDAAARKPLLEALRYPNRRVQYEAALAIGAAQPRDTFPGSESVVRTLGSSIRDASAKYALVVAPDSEHALIGDLFRKDGYTILPPATKLDDVRQAIADAPGVDLIIVNSLPSEHMRELITEAQSDARLRVTPILAIATAQGYFEQAPRYARDIHVRLLREGVGPSEVQAAATELINAASGGLISGPEADGYKARSLGVLRDLAMSGNVVLNAGDAQAPLVTALPDSKGDTKARIAEVLSLIGTKQAQVALVDAALNSDPAERPRLLGFAADSAKRFGNKLDKRQVDALVELTTKGQGEEATAAAALVGALNLEGTGVVPLILGPAK